MEEPKPNIPAILPINFEAGKKYTIYSGSDSAMTNRREICVLNVFTEPEFRPAYVNATRGKWRFGTYKEGRKHSVYYLDLNVAGSLVIQGISNEVLADHEKWSSFAISATMNLAATPERIRELVNTNINPNFSQYDQIIAYPVPLNTGSDDHGILVYPDAPTTHAVIRRMRENLEKEDV